MLKKNCLVCGKEYIIQEYRKNTAKYCSIQCQHQAIKGDGNGKAWLGKKRSTETVLKIKETLKGRRLSPETEFKKGDRSNYERLIKWRENGGKPWNTGTKGLSKSNSGSFNVTGGRKPDNKGVKHWNWKDGRSPLRKAIQSMPEYPTWRTAVFERDKYTCQECNKIGGRIQSHHIKPFYKIIEDNNITTTDQARGCKELWDVSNGQTLCVPCHKQTDSYLTNQYKKT